MRYTREELQEFEEPSFSAPIPGQGLTAEVDARAWKQPPQYTTVAETLDFYMDTLFNRDGVTSIADALQMGQSAIELAESLTMGGVSGGYHTPDVGALVVPAIAETVAMIGTMMDIEFKMGDEEEDEPVPDSTLDLISKTLLDAVEDDRGLEEALNLDDFDLSNDDGYDEEGEPQYGGEKEEEEEEVMPTRKTPPNKGGLMSRGVI